MGERVFRVRRMRMAILSHYHSILPRCFLSGNGVCVCMWWNSIEVEIVIGKERCLEKKE